MSGVGVVTGLAWTQLGGATLPIEAVRVHEKNPGFKLTGKVLPVGGIKEKLIAARRSGIKEIILPEGCIPDFKKLPEHIREGITFHFVKKYKEVFKIVFSV